MKGSLMSQEQIAVLLLLGIDEEVANKIMNLPETNKMNLVSSIKIILDVWGVKNG